MPILFFLFWMALNGRIAADVMVVGVLVSAVMSWFTYRVLGLSFSTEKKMWKKAGAIFIYLIRLVVEVVKANIQMIYIILCVPNEKLKPQLVYFKSPVRSEIGKVALANSITLTPGTISFQVDDCGFGVHAIDAPLSEGIEDSTFVTQLKNIEGGH